MSKVVIALFALLVLLGVASDASARKTPWEKRGVSMDTFWAALEAAYGDQSAAVCLVDERITGVHLKDLMISQSETHHVQIAILDAKAAAEYAELEIPYVRGWHKVKRVSAYTLTNGGSKIKVGGDQIFDVDLFPEYVLYSDMRGKKLAFPAFTDRCVIDYEYTLWSEAPFVWMTHFFQKEIPVEVSRCRLEIPVKMLDPMFWGMGWQQAYSTRNMDTKPKKERLATIDGDIVTYTWQLEDVPPIGSEPYRPADADICPSICFAPGSTFFGGKDLNWTTFGNWFCSTVDERLTPGEAIRAQVRSTTKPLGPGRDCLKAVLEYLRKEIRYAAVEIDEGGWIPSGVNQTMRVKYGDCKDQSALLTAMLREAGIDAELALVRTRDRGRLNKAIVSPYVFNHCIVHAVVDGSEVWLDPTAKYHPCGALPWTIQGVDALVLRPYESELMTTPRSTYQDNALNRIATITLGPDAEALCSGSIMVTGERAAEARAEIAGAGPGRMSATLRDILLTHCPGARDEEVSVDGAEERDGPLVLRFAFKSDALTSRAGEYLLVSPIVFAPPPSVRAFDRPDRTHPVCLHFPERVTDNVMLVVPDGMAVLDLPKDMTKQVTYGYFDRRSAAQGGQVNYTGRFVLPSRYIPLDSYAETRAFLEAIRKAGRDPISLKVEG